MINSVALRGRVPLAFALFSTISVGVALGCGGSTDATTAPPTGPSFKSTPCSVTGTLQLAAAQTARVDCSNGGTTVTLAGNGASYLVVAQFAVDLVQDAFVPYRIIAGTAVAASLAAPSRVPASRMAAASALGAGIALSNGPGARQLAFTRALRARARQKVTLGVWPSASARSRVSNSIRASTLSNAATAAVPAVGSLRQFQVFADSNANSFKTATASLAFVGSNVLLYIDTLAPANGFASSDLQAFGKLFDQTLYPIDTAAFGQPSDIDGNGRVVMLMSPAVNALTPGSDCQSGYVAGFFDEGDLAGGPADPGSNNGEVFYSIVPDPAGTASCAHPVSDVAATVPATFMHELQHLISFSQHVVIHNGQPEYGWVDEGLSIVAEELGSLYYEQKCPGTACRTTPSQMFPDSSQGFIQGLFFDSYLYALLPDTSSLTLNSDSDQTSVAWRGGDWLLMRWLGDQMGSGFYKKLDGSRLTGAANIEAATGQPFPSLFANFGLALYTDSLVGLPRTTAPSVDRFLTRNVRQLWNRVFVTTGGSSFPFAYPVQVFPITADTSTAVMVPGTMSYFRLDTPSNAATVSVQFAGPGGVALPSAMRPQLAIFRLP